MPPQQLCDVSKIDTSKVIAGKDEIYKVNPHRFEFQLLHGIYMVDRPAGLIAGFRTGAADEFWVRGHIPGRPIFPGVLMIETAAQLVSYYVMSRDADRAKNSFLGFGGVTDVKFRGSVLPGQTIVMVGKMVEDKPRRCIGATQGFVNGQMVYEGLITGMWL
jgi:3-hydroxyacyl-[acyl-carrier-protein] dehydratase